MNGKQTLPYDSGIASLKYPQDRARIARLSILGFQMWYASQDARQMIFMAQFSDFRRFIFWHYTWKVKLLRFWYKIKRFLTNA